MDDEKFFETLANEKTAAEEEFKVELAKASSVTTKKTIPSTEKKPAGKKSYDEPDGQLAIDVYQTTSDIIIESAIAGVKSENIDIDVTNDSVTIRGERSREHEVKNDDYYYQECYWGRFSRSVILPQEVARQKQILQYQKVPATYSRRIL